MNKTKQFWALFKFQTTVNPFILFMPLVFGIPLLIPLLTSSLTKSYHAPLETQLMIQNLFFVGFFGVMLIAPEKFQFGGSNVSSAYFGTEFLLTRAIDRPVLYRAKATLLYLLVLIIPLLTILHSLKEPDLIVDEYSKPVQQECLRQVPGSTLMPAESKKSPRDTISIPRGNVLVTEWQFWSFLVTAIALQLLLALLYPFKYGKFVLWLLFFGMIFVPMFAEVHSIGNQTVSLYETLFFSFSAHQLLFWSLTASALILTQLWCERRFARFEQ